MEIRPAVRRRSVPGEQARRHRRRLLTDQITRRVIAFGGTGVFAAMILILVYLAWVALPLFAGADARARELGARSDWAGQETRWLAVDERSEVGLRIDEAGTAFFFSLDDLTDLRRWSLLPSGASRLTAVAADRGRGGLTALAFDNGDVRLLRESYDLVFDAGPASRRIEPSLQSPFGGDALKLAPGRAPERLALADGGDRLALAGLAGGTVHLLLADKRQNLLDGGERLDARTRQFTPAFEPTALAVSGDARTLYLGAGDGSIHAWRLPDLEPAGSVRPGDAPITVLEMLVGGRSLLAGDGAGTITQLFPVRDDQGRARLTAVRSLDSHSVDGQGAEIVALLPEQRRRGFVALDADGRLGVHHSTARRTLLMRDTGPGAVTPALAPRADGVLLLGADGHLEWLAIDNPHPEVSWRTLWGRVWYENYQEPRYLWQSTAATNDFEAKFSLTPLAFGTLKAALYAMLFAAPLALAGAAYTAVFMAPALRRKVKPTIEIMAALPTVILGFLAGLWLAPYVEEHLALLLLLLLLTAPLLVLFGWCWSRLPAGLTRLVPGGWEPLLLLPVLCGLFWLAASLADPLQAALFGTDLTTWLTEQVGVGYDQRNAIVVGIAMGLSVTPTIFSIAEDALYAVPRSLSNGSLALGATRWQTLSLVILPTASPGIFSGLMIGFGRAVGETMIVLMATGNTAIMDWSLFEGMRTLAANIAIEMPESEVRSTHFRILFLSALVLFLFTFLVNTGAEIVRQRLRARYSRL